MPTLKDLATAMVGSGSIGTGGAGGSGIVIIRKKH
jgi:hypothetical protein